MTSIYPAFEALVGATISSWTVSADEDELVMTLADGRVARLYHSQDCCESVYLAEVIGDPGDLIGEPLIEAEEVEHENNVNPEGVDASGESFTWTFYKLGTRKGHVTLRWLGESNGYYSESVTFSMTLVAGDQSHG